MYAHGNLKVIAALNCHGTALGVCHDAVHCFDIDANKQIRIQLIDKVDFSLDMGSSSII
jgi:hypothetical protein